MRRFITILAAAFAFGALAEAADATVTVNDAWVRASAGGNGAAYATLANAGTADDRLIAVKGDAAASIELHEVIMEGDVMQMRPVDGIAVPAGGSAELKPGGSHIMLIGLKAPLAEGDHVALTFVFETAGEIALDVPVQAAASTGHEGGHDHHDMH